ncbi:VCBS domain-containing protein [Vibrio lentus]|uniref:VCBS domain-containing protein n=1 Tax=Vibrio lentus TaxID=136468 RepID=UPI0039AFE022
MGRAESFTVTTSVDGTEQARESDDQWHERCGDDRRRHRGREIADLETDAEVRILSLSGTLTATDVDNADNTFTATSIEGTNGTFSIAENGEWTFVANSAFNEMNVGDSKVESFTVTSVDGTEASRESDDQWHERCGDDRRRHRGRGL